LWFRLPSAGDVSPNGNAVDADDRDSEQSDHGNAKQSDDRNAEYTFDGITRHRKGSIWQRLWWAARTKWGKCFFVCSGKLCVRWRGDFADKWLGCCDYR
jgi:hypothetical protein